MALGVILSFLFGVYAGVIFLIEGKSIRRGLRFLSFFFTFNVVIFPIFKMFDFFGSSQIFFATFFIFNSALIWNYSRTIKKILFVFEILPLCFGLVSLFYYPPMKWLLDVLLAVALKI